MMTPCATTISCLVAFQPLIAAIFAVGAALTSAYVIWSSAKLTDIRERERDIKQEKQKLRFVANLLSSEIHALTGRTRAIQGTIKAIRAADKTMTEKGAASCRMYLPNDVDNWNSVGLLPQNIQRDLFSFRRLLNQHNENMQVGHSFASEKIDQQINRQLQLIATEGEKLVGALILVAKEIC